MFVVSYWVFASVLGV